MPVETDTNVVTKGHLVQHVGDGVDIPGVECFLGLVSTLGLDERVVLVTEREAEPCGSGDRPPFEIERDTAVGAMVHVTDDVGLRRLAVRVFGVVGPDVAEEMKLVLRRFRVGKVRAAKDGAGQTSCKS